MIADPYATLNLPWGAPEAEVRQAFRRLALRYHPDRNPGDSAAEARFKLISAAYQRLQSASFRLPNPSARPEPGPRAAWSQPSPRWSGEDADDDAEWEPPPRPEFWPDGERIHYPTQREIEELMLRVQRPSALSSFRTGGDRLLQAVAYLYFGVLLVSVAAGAVLLAVVVVLGLRDLLGLR